MDYYMEVGMMEDAFFGIELYGCDIMGAAKILRLASFGALCYQERMMKQPFLWLMRHLSVKMQ